MTDEERQQWAQFMRMLMPHGNWDERPVANPDNDQAASEERREPSSAEALPERPLDSPARER